MNVLTRICGELGGRKIHRERWQTLSDFFPYIYKYSLEYISDM